MKIKPSWGLWLTCVLGYTALDMVIAFFLHGGPRWSQVPGATEGALFGGSITWLVAFYRWHKADAGL